MVYNVNAGKHGLIAGKRPLRALSCYHSLMDTIGWAFKLGDRVQKISGSEWDGRVAGFYSTVLTPRGYCIESAFHRNSVQNYPEKALELSKEGI